MIRLDKYLAERLGLTRSESRRKIAAGAVAVDGAVCKRPDAKLDENTAQVALEGKPLAAPYEKYVYLMLNKPVGVVSASRDARETTVADLAASAYPRRQLFPAGRLDKTSTGFVLLTDDGGLCARHPGPRPPCGQGPILSSWTPPLTAAMQAGFAAGVTLADGTRLAPAAAEPAGADPCCVRVTLRPGRLPPDQAHVRRLRRGGQRAAPGSHRPGPAGPGPRPGRMEAADRRGAGRAARRRPDTPLICSKTVQKDVVQCVWANHAHFFGASRRRLANFARLR